MVALQVTNLALSARSPFANTKLSIARDVGCKRLRLRGIRPPSAPTVAGYPAGKRPLSIPTMSQLKGV